MCTGRSNLNSQNEFDLNFIENVAHFLYTRICVYISMRLLYPISLNEYLYAYVVNVSLLCLTSGIPFKMNKRCARFCASVASVGDKCAYMLIEMIEWSTYRFYIRSNTVKIIKTMNGRCRRRWCFDFELIIEKYLIVFFVGLIFCPSFLFLSFIASSTVWWFSFCLWSIIVIPVYLWTRLEQLSQQFLSYKYVSLLCDSF